METVWWFGVTLLFYKQHVIKRFNSFMIRLLILKTSNNFFFLSKNTIIYVMIERFMMTLPNLDPSLCQKLSVWKLAQSYRQVKFGPKIQYSTIIDKTMTRVRIRMRLYSDYFHLQQIFIRFVPYYTRSIVVGRIHLWAYLWFTRWLSILGDGCHDNSDDNTLFIIVVYSKREL